MFFTGRINKKINFNHLIFSYSQVVTHGEDGQRERYFGDDDELDLKTLVQREKMSTAEDQHKLFGRMAAKVSALCTMYVAIDSQDHYQYQSILCSLLKWRTPSHYLSSSKIIYSTVRICYCKRESHTSYTRVNCAPSCVTHIYADTHRITFSCG